MKAALLAVAPTPFVTLQDGGRFGWQRFGVSRSGAMDMEALALANALVGNPPEMAALEFAHAGGEWEAGAISCRVAVTGGHFAITVDDVPVAAGSTITLTRGQRLRVGGSHDAVWGYIAVAQGFDLAPQLGSLSTHARSGIGGFSGRPIRAGDVLPLAAEWVRAEPERALPPLRRALGRVRVVLGPQDDFFTPSAITTFLSAEYRVTHQMDRLGYRLDGPVLEHAGGYNIISDGLVPGCIQVPGSGAPIVLLRDAQPPGGYPKIATVISADLGRLAQIRPGRPVRFEQVDVAQAQDLRRDFAARIAGMRALIGDRGGLRLV